MRISKKKYKKMLIEIARFEDLQSRLKAEGPLFVAQRKPYSDKITYARLSV